jgi:hypothetical protein
VGRRWGVHPAELNRLLAPAAIAAIAAAVGAVRGHPAVVGPLPSPPAKPAGLSLRAQPAGSAGARGGAHLSRDSLIWS